MSYGIHFKSNVAHKTIKVVEKVRLKSPDSFVVRVGHQQETDAETRVTSGSGANLKRSPFALESRNKASEASWPGVGTGVEQY